MQQSQQLQWKRTQQEQCLSSRKRKLSELFSVTAHPNLDDYNAKLQAFHNANNFKSGRAFDGSTLPPRVRLTRLSRREQSTPGSKSGPPPLAIIDSTKSPAKAQSYTNSKPEFKSRAIASRQTSPVTAKDKHNVPSAPHITRDEGAAEDSTIDKTSAMVDDENQPTIHGKEMSKPELQQSLQSSDSQLQGTVHTDAASHARPSSPTSMVNGTSTQPDPTLASDATVVARSNHEAASPATSPADGNEESPLTNAKTVNIPKQPDTPDSTQQPSADDPSAMNVDAAADEMGVSETGAAEISDTAASTINSASRESLRPSMRIYTPGTGNNLEHSNSEAMAESPAPITADTPQRSQPPASSLFDSSKRATRISSGAIQKKSVSEILNDAQRSQSDTPVSESRDSTAAADRREKERSKLSTVVFARPHRTDNENSEVVRVDGTLPGSPKERDYLYTLFENKAHSMSRNGSLNYLIANAHKTLLTADHLVDYEMQSHCRVLKRIYQLQERGRWALRQHKRSEEPPRSTSHWDILLDHAKWMRTDFREERKWKLVAARGLAEECAEWVRASPEVRKLMQVKVPPPNTLAAEHLDTDEDIAMDEGPGPAMSSQPTPELIPSNEDDSMSDDIADPRDIATTISPAAIFSLGASEFTFQAVKTPAFDKLLNELPLYEPAPIIPDFSKSDLAERLDSRWKMDIVPVSKYATEKLEVKEDKPRRKRSRYEYDVEMSPTRKFDPLPPRQRDVALFMTENKHIRDRIHPGHSFRPPTEHPMPTQEFFQTRSSSQWTTAEDDELRKLVKDYSYNWSLIASCLGPRSLYTSGADRRTPWECFERWIGLEGLPADMSKTPYFKTYSGRIEAAGRHVLAQIEEAQRRAGANVQIPARKRTTQPVRVDRKRTQRHLAMLDAMRKLAKKRELAIQKQQHQSEVAAMRKMNASEINQPKAPFSKPQEFAALRQERDQKRAEQQEMYRQQLLAHQRAAQQRGGNTGMSGLPNGIPNGANGMRAASGGMPGIPNGNLQVPNSGRPHPAVMAAMNGMQMPQGMMGQKNMAQAQMQANIARGMATSPEQIRMMQQASKVQQQQELMRQAQQQGGQQSSPNNPHASLANGNFNLVNGAASPSNVNGNASSPRSANSGGQLSSGHTPVLTQIANGIKMRFPNMSEDEVQRHATQQIQLWQQQASTGQKRPPQNQAALNAAVGAMNSAAHASNNAVNTNFPHQNMPQLTPEQMQQYQAQRMRMMQAQQQGGAARQAQQGAAAMQGMNMGMGMGMQGQMMPGQGQIPVHSPNMSMSRPVSQGQGSAGGVQAQQQQLSRSGTPNVRDGRSGSMSAQPSAPGIGSPAPGQQQMIRPGSSRGNIAGLQGQQLQGQASSGPLPSSQPQQLAVPMQMQPTQQQQQQQAMTGSVPPPTPPLQQPQPIAQQTGGSS